MTIQSDLTKCDCKSCPLAKAGVPFHKPVSGHGPAAARIAIVGEAPGRDEVFEGKPFVGPTGELVNALLADVGIRREDIYLTNSTLCVPPDGQKASSAALKACRPRLIDELQRSGAELVLSLGSFAVKQLLQTPAKITQLEGAMYGLPDVSPTCRILPTFHPAAVLRGGEMYFEPIHEAFKRVKRIIVDGIEPPRIDIDLDHVPITQVQPPDAKQWLETLIAKADVEPKGTLWSQDLETGSLAYLTSQVLQVGIFDGFHAYVFDVGGNVRLESGEWGQPLPGWDDETIAVYQQLVNHPNITWVFHNKSFDLQFIRHWFRTEIPQTKDTMCLAFGLTEKQKRVGLDVLARQWFNAQPYWEQLEKWFTTKNRKKLKFHDVPRRILAKYLAADCIYTLSLVKPLEAAVAIEGTTQLTHLLERYQVLFSKMEYRGAFLDVPYIEQLRKTWRPVIEEAKRELQLMARGQGFDARNYVKAKRKDGDLNPGSPKQLMGLFFEVMKLKPVFNQKRKMTTGKEFIAKYKDHAIVKKMVEYRTVKKMMSTFVDGIEKHLWPDKRIHYDILLGGTVTGRLAIKNPPLQTIPKEKRLKVKFDSLRKLFIPDQRPLRGLRSFPIGANELTLAKIRKTIMVEADYAQLEMRVAWHYSKDPALGEALMSEDFHKFMAAKIFKCRLDEVTDEMRHRSKFVTFGILYGRQAYSLAVGELQCSVAEAQMFIDAFFAAAPLLAAWWHATQREAIDKGELTTTIGRKRRWPLITPKNVQEVRNQAVNFPVQSLASDLNTMAADRLWPILESLDYGFPLFPVHDAIMFELYEDTLHLALPIIKREMETPPFETCAKFEVDISAGPSWGELTKVKVAK